MTTPEIKIITSENYFIILAAGFTDYPNRGSALTILNRQGDVIVQKEFPDALLIDLDITNENQLLVLSDNRLSDFYDTLSTPIKVSLFDFNLNLLSEKDYGVPFILIHRIKILIDDNEFIVLGTSRLTHKFYYTQDL